MEEIEIVIPDSIRDDFEEKGGIDGISRSIPDCPRLEEIALIARALSDPVRIRVLLALCVQPMCVCLLVAMTGYSYSKMSYHLNVLKEVGLVRARQEWNYLIYRPTDLGKKVAEYIKSV